MSNTQKESEAKKYISKVIDQMALADSDLKTVIQANISDLIDECLPYKKLGKSFQFNDNSNLSKSIDEVLQKLRKDIFNFIYIRSLNVDALAREKENDNSTDDKFLLAFLSLKIAGLTLDMRINKFVNNIRSEVEAYIAAGFAKGLTKNQILSEYINWIKLPFSSPLIINAFRQVGFKAERIVSKGVTFGVGKYVSGFNSLKRVQQDQIFRTYNHTLQDIWGRDRNYIGWYTIRGSSYQCGYCDEQVGRLHPKEESFGGYHIRCCCIMIPLYKNEVL